MDGAPESQVIARSAIPLVWKRNDLRERKRERGESQRAVQATASLDYFVTRCVTRRVADSFASLHRCDYQR